MIQYTRILVRYADDTVIICKNKKSANHAQSLLQYIMGKLDLRLHPVKTKIINIWDGTEGFDFLGLHHRRFSKINKKGNRYGETYQYPSKKAMKKMKRTVKESINQRYLLVKTEEELIKVLNLKITGWRNYYKTGKEGKSPLTYSTTKQEICVLQIKNVDVTMYCNKKSKINVTAHLV